MATEQQKKMISLMSDTHKIAEIDKHIKDHEKAEAEGTVKLGANDSDLCRLYVKWGPVLKFASGLLFFKPKWQKGFRIFVQAIETNCDINQPEE